MRSLHIGHFRQRVTVQVLSGTTKDSYGQTTQIWADAATYWGEVLPVRAKNITVAGQVESLITHTVRFRWLGSAVTLGPSTHRLKLGSRLFSIVGSINVEERNRMYELSVTEIEA